MSNVDEQIQFDYSITDIYLYNNIFYSIYMSTCELYSNDIEWAALMAVGS